MDVGIAGRVPARCCRKGRGSAPPTPQAGFSLVEVMITGVVLVVALGGFLSTILSGLQVNATSRRSAVGSEIAQGMLETLYAEDLGRVFAAYNNDPADDGGLPAPGGNFVIARSSWQANNADGVLGTIEFPTLPGFPGVLREDVVDPSLGMPRDLNGDGVIDGLNHAGDYRVLPVKIEVTWPGGSRVTLSSLLGGI
ncbi:MAG: prepilin-type N-terminal cleavage/methylation domain-containing protein [Planctomycetes bacterium]|nr:prepilin-type N-terminal cleavage/methylation domain-containing protein [Planctomycetota bacterium]HPF12738.1 hypothetical protein [Planctomycetota bacterium]